MCFGHSRDRKRGRPSVACGPLADRHERPLAVRAYPGNTADPATVPDQVEALRRSFGLQRLVLVGDRGHAQSCHGTTANRVREVGAWGRDESPWFGPLASRETATERCWQVQVGSGSPAGMSTGTARRPSGKRDAPPSAVQWAGFRTSLYRPDTIGKRS